MARILCGSLLVLAVISSAAALSMLPTATRTLNLPATPYRYSTAELPAHFTKPGPNYDNTPVDNPLHDDGATLGRVLFYDTRLSANDTTSCASCHVQAHAFADPRRFSKGFHGAHTDRRAMPLVNVRYYQRSRFFWDERADNLETMVLQPITSRIEMGQNLTRLVETLARDRTYRVLFARAFGDRQVTEERIGRALAQFVRSLSSYQSKYDEGRARVQSAGDDFDNFTLQENRGKALFMRNCATCHRKDENEHFFVQLPANTRLRSRDPSADGGVADATLRFEDLGSFKSPSLRNVEVTAPYGHDGRFATLDALIDHYSDTPIADPNLGYVTPRGLEFTSSEKAALVAFLKTLTDPTFLTDPKFSNPFVESKHAAVAHFPLALPSAKALLITAGTAAVEPLVVLTSPVLVPEAPPSPIPALPKRSHPVIERLVSFDSNADHGLSRHELPERMQELVTGGDRNRNDVLDSDEIRDLVYAAAAKHTRARHRVQAQASEGLTEVINDLRLPPATHAHALAIVSTHKLSHRFNDAVGRVVQAKLRAVLNDEEYENFVAAAARLVRTVAIPCCSKSDE